MQIESAFKHLVRLISICIFSACISGCSIMSRPTNQQIEGLRRIAIVSIGHDVLMQTDSRNLLFSAKLEMRDISSWQLDTYLMEKSKQHIESATRVVIPDIKFDTRKFEQIYSSERRPSLLVESGIWPAAMKEEIRRLGKDHNLDAVVFIYAASSRSDGRVDPTGVNLWTAGVVNPASTLWLVTRIKVFGARTDMWELNGYLSRQVERVGYPAFPRARIPEDLAKVSFDSWSPSARDDVRKTIVELIDSSLAVTFASILGK